MFGFVGFWFCGEFGLVCFSFGFGVFSGFLGLGFCSIVWWFWCLVVSLVCGFVGCCYVSGCVLIVLRAGAC